MVLVSLQTQKLMVATRKLPYSAQSDFPLLSIGKKIQRTPQGRMVLNRVNPALICRTMNTGGVLCASHQFLKIRPLPWGFLLWYIMLLTSTWPWGVVARSPEPSRFCNHCLLLRSAGRVTPAATGASPKGENRAGIHVSSVVRARPWQHFYPLSRPS